MFSETNMFSLARTSQTKLLFWENSTISSSKAPNMITSCRKPNGSTSNLDVKQAENKRRRYRLCRILRNSFYEAYQPISTQRVESRRINMVRYLRRVYSEEFHSFLKVRVSRIHTTPVTKKALGARMGKGKGPFHENVVRLKKTRRYKPSTGGMVRYDIIVPYNPSIFSTIRTCAILRSKKMGTPISIRRMLTIWKEKEMWPSGLRHQLAKLTLLKKKT